MLMMLKESGAMVEVVSPPELWDPFVMKIYGRRPAGEEMQDREQANRADPLAAVAADPIPYRGP